MTLPLSQIKIEGCFFGAMGGLYGTIALEIGGDDVENGTNHVSGLQISLDTCAEVFSSSSSMLSNPLLVIIWKTCFQSEGDSGLADFIMNI